MKDRIFLSLNLNKRNENFLKGSLLGGSKLTIEGSGFTGLAAITIGNVIYYLTAANETLMTFNSLSVITQPNEGEFNVSVTLDNIPVSWRSTSSSYLFSAAYTPTVSSISPQTVNGPAEMTLVGTGFGNSSELLLVKIGNQTCQVTDVNDTRIVCQLVGLELGAQSVSVNVNGKLKLISIVIFLIFFLCQ